MNQDECSVVEFFARRNGVSFESLATSEGHLVVLGSDSKCFDVFAKAMAFVTPGLVEPRDSSRPRAAARVVCMNGFG